MLFCTIQYVYFLTAVFGLYWALPSQRARVWLLLAASLYFYATWNKWLALLIGATTVMDFLIALGMETSARGRVRKLLLLLSLAVNLGVLVAFKYANFFIESLADALGQVGASASLPLLSVVLPVGISFYTFEAINYTVDVYRRRIPAERDLAHFMLFILFFPHLVAGPIVRARDFLPQLRRPKLWDWQRLGLGLRLIVLGTFKKLAIADRMAAFADPVFKDPAAYSRGAVWLAALAFAMQIYCDFSGYSDIALGSAHLFGYKLAINFRLPYLSSNITEFWRRWHISLSNWLRDYLFIPLGGSRNGRWQTYRNLLIVMTLGGLWHGARWNFVIWGSAQGLLLIGHKIFLDWRRAWPGLNALFQSVPWRAASAALTFVAAVLSFVIFRSDSLHNLGILFSRLMISSDGREGPTSSACVWCTFLALGIGHWLGVVLGRNRFAAWRFVQSLPAPAVGFGYAAMLNVALLLGPAASKAFLYFQF